MIKFLMVDVESVTSSVLRSEFPESDLEIIADMILESGGILKPLVLKRIGFERYEVVDGHLEYYAAVRAREKNPSEGEMVNALIISPESEEAILKQAATLRELESTDKSVKNTAETKKSESSRLANIESRLEKQINELRAEQAKERQNLEDKLKKIESQIPKKITPLEVFNTLSLSELALRLRSAGFTDKTAAKIAEALEKERKKKEFDSLNNVVERVKIKTGKRQIKGISSDKMVAIIDSWSRTLFI
jgi:predicted nucleic acid-binding OB-fold protein